MATQSNYDKNIQVRQDVINRIKSMGMNAALAAARSGNESAEFNEGARRMYGASRVGTAGTNRAPTSSANYATQRGGGSDNSSSAPGSKSVPMPASAPAAASRKVSTPPAGLSANNMQQLDRYGKNVGQVASGIAAAGKKNVVSSTAGGIRNLYRTLTHTQKGAKPKNG